MSVLHGPTRACCERSTGDWTQPFPGNGSLRERYNAWDANNAVPREKLVPALERLQQVLGPRAHAIAPMPAEESVSYELVAGVPWIAYNRYEGRHHSRVEVNADLPVSVALLASLAAHEAYPGHHTERVAKDAHLYRDLGRVETSVAISAPESLVSEGIATNALDEALGREPFAVIADVLADIDLRFDPLEAHEVHEAELALYAPAVNAAFMLHEDGASARRCGGIPVRVGTRIERASGEDRRVPHRSVVPRVRVGLPGRAAHLPGLRRSGARELHTAPDRAAHHH